MDGRRSRQPPSTTGSGSPGTAETTIPSTQRAEAGESRQPLFAAPPLAVPAGVDPTASLLAAQALIANALGQHPAPVPEAAPQAGPALPRAQHATPQGNAPDPLISLQTRLPAVDPALFRAILENRLQPENIIKLSSSFRTHGISRRQETVSLGPYVIPTTEKDAEASDYRGVGALLQPLFIYFQALVHFAPYGIKINLVAALFEYVDLLLELNRYYFFDTVKLFHFTFHRKRMTLGVYDPEGWREKDVALQGQVLVRRPADPTLATGKRTFDKAFPRPSVGGNPTAVNICNNWQEGHCRGFCRYRHACRTCDGSHPAKDHVASGTTPLTTGTNANALVLRDAGRLRPGQ